jgi:hypothetical protein
MFFGPSGPTGLWPGLYKSVNKAFVFVFCYCIYQDMMLWSENTFNEFYRIWYYTAHPRKDQI